MAGKVFGGVAEVEEAGDLVRIGALEEGAGFFEVFADLAGVVVVDGAGVVGQGGFANLVDEIGDFAHINSALVEAADGHQVFATQMLHGGADFGEEVEIAGEQVVDADQLQVGFVQTGFQVVFGQQAQQVSVKGGYAVVVGGGAFEPVVEVFVGQG